MGEVLDVDVGRIRDAPPKFESAGEKLTEALTQLRQVLAGCAEMCGDDEQGREFAAGYNPAAATIEKSLTFAAKGVSKVGDAVKGMADGFTGAEDTNTRVSRTSGGGR